MALVGLKNEIMADGSRHFLELTFAIELDRVTSLLTKLDGAVVTNILAGFTECWVDFTYAGYAFSMHDPFGHWWVFSNNPHCPETVLLRIKTHFDVVKD
jgi:hypothetical protein